MRLKSMRNVLQGGGIAAVMILLGSGSVFAAQPEARLTVYTDAPLHAISPTMVGLFFEDINFGADGGLYAELVKNRSFEFPESMMGWSVLKQEAAEGTAVVIRRENYTPANANCLRIQVQKAGSGYGLSNEGFRGIGLHKGQTYYFSVFAQTAGAAMALRAEAVAADGRKLLDGTIENISGDWKNYTCLMEAVDTEARAELKVLVTAEGTIDLDMISLFPADTARHTDRPIPGLRKDLVEMLAAVKPGFLRFPGGCIVEGMYLANRYQWKNTIGDICDRPTIVNRWNLEFRHRLTPDYYQSFGLGFFEYFLLCEQIGAEPMPIINCGMACQFNTGETAAMDKLGPYVQDALDLIEFANGPADSAWGKRRAQMGHPEPFGLQYLGVGNEQWGPQYVERYKVFEKALKEKYPKVQLIAATGSDPEIFPNGPAEVKYLWSQWRTLKPDIVDEHFYRPYAWFFENTNYYDSYDRQGPKLFIGEYAAMTHGVAKPENRNSLICALAEAAFLTGLERNGDLVTMSAYAPLSGHVDGWQWKPNLLWFDNLTSFSTPNYYVQQLFSLNKGTGFLKTDLVLPASSAAGSGRTSSLYVSSTKDEKTGRVFIKAVNPTDRTVMADITLEGKQAYDRTASVITLAGGPNDENSIDQPRKVAPKESVLEGIDKVFSVPFAPYSLTVLALKQTGV
jgi:alpha-N-arabinofuranosidase